MNASKSYIVCAVQRSGSSLLCEALKNTGLAGVPEEYFLTMAEAPMWEVGEWAREHGVSSRQGFVDLVLDKGTTANGVFGIKLMWNYLPLVVSKLEALPQYKSARTAEIFGHLFPNLHYIWLVREDKVRQAVSWSIAAQTGIYAAWQAGGKSDIPQPVFNFEQIDALHGLVLAGERGWQAYFEANQIMPHKVLYESLVAAYRETACAILDFLDIPYPQELLFADRQLVRQSTGLNDEWANRYLAMKVGSV